MDVNDIGIALLRGLFAGLPFGLALVLGISLPLIVVALSSATRNISPNTRSLIIIGAIVFGSTLSVAFSGRTLFSDAELLRNPALSVLNDGRSSIGAKISQICTAIALIVSLAEIYRCLTSQFNTKSAAAKLWIMLFAYYLISIGLAGLIGEFREVELRYVYFIIITSGLLTMASEINEKFWRGARWLLLIPAMGSLVCMAIAPKVVLLNDYEAFIPGMTSRLFGLSDHANGIGIVAATALALEFSTIVRRSPSIAVVAIHLTILLLSQSKTAWLAMIAVLMVVRWQWLTSETTTKDPWQRKSWLIVSIVLVAVAVTILGVIAANSTTIERALEAKSVFTLTGRFRIWEITIEEFIKSPILGYGPALWDLRYRIEHGIPSAGQAHNQFIHILGQAGLMGFFSMIGYVLLLGWMAYAARGKDNGLTLALFLLIMIRCITESPLRLGGIMGWENFLHILVAVGAASFASKQLANGERLGLVKAGATLKPQVLGRRLRQR